MKFIDIPYKDQEKEKLRKQVVDGRIPHAQLFLGKEGSGNLAMALAYITYIYCTNRSSDDSCGECPSCRGVSKLAHPDLHFSFPVVSIDGKKREDTTSDDFLPQWREVISSHPFLTTSIWQQKLNVGNTKPNINSKECNDIIHKLAFNTFTDGPKILLMWLPEYLGKEGNKLLKLIEEPTPNTNIILVAEEQDKILNTILSRCQMIKCFPFTEEEITSFLIEKKGVDKGIAAQYGRLSEGNIAKALDLCNGEEKNLSEILFDWLRSCYKDDVHELYTLVDEMATWNLEKITQFLEYSLHFFQTYMNWIFIGNEHPRMSDVEKVVAKKMITIFDPKKVELICERINALIYFINRNGNKKINFLAESLTIGDILKNRQETSINNVIFAKESLLIQ
jgi:DNA polymerase III subunit delta'